MTKLLMFLLLGTVLITALTTFVDADMTVATRRLGAERVNSRMDANRRQREQERRVRDGGDDKRDFVRRQRSTDVRRMDERDSRRRVLIENSRSTARIREDSTERRVNIAAARDFMDRGDVRTVADARDLATLNNRRTTFTERDNRIVREENARRTDIGRYNVGMDKSRRTVERMMTAVDRRSGRQMDGATSMARRRSSLLSVAIGDASRRRDLREKDLTRTDDRMGNLGYARAMKITDEQGNGGWVNIAISGSLAMFAIIFYIRKANGKQGHDNIKCD